MDADKLPGNWWLAYPESGEVWPCDVLRPSVWPGHVVVVPTHEAAPGHGTTMNVSRGRVYDSNFNRPTWR